MYIIDFLGFTFLAYGANHIETILYKVQWKAI